MKKKIVYISILIVALLASAAPSQQHVIDSLNQTVKTQKLASEQNEQDIIGEKDRTERNIIISFAIVVLVFGGASAITIYRILQKSRRKTDLIARQKVLVEERQKEIIDSINYAQRIQRALLKEEERVSMNLPDHFILFMPKDIVSGDFYWALHKDDYFYITAADCTGHGIPGGFMSMLGIAFLNEITSQSDPLTPSIILNMLRDKILKEFGKTGAMGENQDGMDISLLRINLKTKIIRWSGANNPLWYFENGNLKEIEPDKQPVGYYPVMKLFSNHMFEAQKNSIFYLFSDGYADQFGGPMGKKFKAAQLKEVLQSIHQRPMKEQKQILMETFKKWKGKLEQVDDVLIIGIRV
jgi:serine phosphatase RsbU (regulator of sigma subunit)